MRQILNRLLHLVGYRHADWQPYGAVMMRFHDGSWESREPDLAEAREIENFQAFQP